MDLQSAFEAYDGSKVYVDCQSKDIILWRAKIRQSTICHSRDLLNSLRRLLRASAVLTQFPTLEQRTIGLSVGTKRVIAGALTRQWIGAIEQHRKFLTNTVANLTGWKDAPFASDENIYRRTVSGSPV